MHNDASIDDIITCTRAVNTIEADETTAASDFLNNKKRKRKRERESKKEKEQKTRYRFLLF